MTKNNSSVFINGENSNRLAIEDCVVVTKTLTTITVVRNSVQAFEVRQEWNEDSLECDLMIDERRYDIWQISQKAIGDLLFGYG